MILIMMRFVFVSRPNTLVFFSSFLCSKGFHFIQTFAESWRKHKIMNTMVVRPLYDFLLNSMCYLLFLCNYLRNSLAISKCENCFKLFFVLFFSFFFCRHRNQKHLLPLPKYLVCNRAYCAR